MSIEKERDHGPAPGWLDLKRRHPRKVAKMPVEIVEALNDARDNGVPAYAVVKAISMLNHDMAANCINGE